MKSFIAIPALLALGAVAQDATSQWAFTWTFTSDGSTVTSATTATDTIGPVDATTSAPASGTSIYVTSYTAVFSSGNVTQLVPTVVSYSEGSNFTSMIGGPADPKTTTSSNATTTASSSSASLTSSGSSTGSSTDFSFGSASATTSGAGATESASTGAAVPNIDGTLTGMGALVMAGLALFL